MTTGDAIGVLIIIAVWLTLVFLISVGVGIMIERWRRK